MKRLFIFALLQLFSVSSFAAIQLEATRVIYNSNSSSASLSLNNSSNQNYMLQSWLENENPRNSAAIPMQVIPPIMRIDAGKEATLRFIYSGHGLPTNRESLFWINLQEIPPSAKDSNTLQIAVHSRLKLFYRPQGLNTTLEKEVQKLVWRQSGNKLSVTNNGPMYVSLNRLHLGSGKDIYLDMVAPDSTEQFTLPANTQVGSAVSFSYVNDFGGTSEVKNFPTK
ncbi:fimbrial biogenesis chaperone [Tatumella sp. UBA2305]|uniref:fimbrial biogenesis chaperone n=1 Tax=Tatumella sp. UBA2305 TaxID=1947647 RepID=UPI0025F095D9|nr:molecular chaperone [Tatumella sp. UBA2305]